jgi:hypothetical protein
MQCIKSIMAALLLCAVTSVANAAEYHWRVTSYIEDAVKLCKEHGGTPGTPDYEKLVRLTDVNNDGHDDYVIDYRYFPCQGGAPNIFCGDGTCSISFLAWLSDNEWKGFLHTTAADWRVRKGDKPALLLLQHGDRYCHRPHLPRCTTVYTFRKGAMSGVSRDAKYFRTAK